jgi:hypothetical protein
MSSQQMEQQPSSKEADALSATFESSSLFCFFSLFSGRLTTLSIMLLRMAVARILRELVTGIWDYDARS